MKKIPVSLVGIGGYGRKLAQFLRQSGCFEIASCFHPDYEKCIQAAEALGCRALKHKTDIVSDDALEAVVVSVPDPSHAEYINIALDHNCHIFVEKPMLQSWEEVVALEPLVAESRKVFFVGHNMRREPGFRYIKKDFDAGRLGQLVTFDIHLSHGGVFHWDNSYWRTDQALCREGPLRINGVHASDIVEYLFGPIQSVYAKFDKLSTPFTAPDSGIAMVEACHRFGTITTNWNVPSINRFHFIFTDAVVEYDLEHLFIRYGRDIKCVPTQTTEISLPTVNSRVEQLVEFARAIRTGDRRVETGWPEGKRALMFVESCYRSDLLNRPYRLKELTL